ncbi:unnamed protein product [Absidia cylindrospora]
MHHSCGNGSCCSPSKLWRQIQTIVRTGTEQDFVRLCGDGRAPHVARVLLSQRLVNDPAMYPASNKHRVLQLNLPHQQLVRLFGTSARDLNALQMALFLRNESMARTILEFLQDCLSTKELAQFVNHSWGQKNSSLHLAAYWGMVSLVRLLLECGADSTHRNARQRGPLDGCTNLACIQLLQPTSINTTTTSPTTKRRPSPTPTPTMATPLPRTSMLLKKAVQHVAELPMDSLLTDDHYQQQHRHRITPIVTDNNNNHEPTINTNNKPTLVFSSSTSSSSLSSLDEPSSPGSPLLFLSSKPSRQPATSDLVLLNDENDVEYLGKQQQQCWMPSSPMTPPMTPLSPTSGYHGDHDDDLDDDRHDNRRSMTFSPNPMDQPTPMCHRLLRPPFPLRSPPPPIRSPSVADDEEEDDDDDNETNLLPPTPTSPTGIMCNNNKKPPLPKKIKSVRFSPDIVLFDACVRGDVSDLTDLMKQQQNQQPSKPTSLILQEWEQQHFFTSRSASPSSMLHIALLHRQEKMAKYLISVGADVNATDQDGWTPLHYAATLQLWPTVDVLAHHPDILLHMKTNNGLKVYDCPRALVDQRRCRTMIERAARKHQQQQSPKPLPQPCLV